MLNTSVLDNHLGLLSRIEYFGSRKFQKFRSNRYAILFRIERLGDIIHSRKRFEGDV